MMISTEYEKALEIMKGVAPDNKTASILLQKGHEKNDFRATYALATWYLHGEYFELNLGKGTELLKLAAKNNIPDALYDLAVSYEEGIEVDKNKKTAFELYLKASVLGDKQSIFEVARCYNHGIGIKKDERLAEIYFDLAEHFNIVADFNR